MSPDSKTGLCRFTKQENGPQLEEFITQAIVTSDKMINCAAPHGEGAHGEFFVEIAIDIVPPRSNDPKFFKSQDTFVIYDLPIVDGIYPTILPVEGGTIYNVTISSYNTRLMKDATITKQCRFDDDPGSVSEAKCILAEKATCSCYNQRKAKPNTSVQLYFTQNEIHFNNTKLDPIVRYETPQLYELVPPEGNITGGTLVTVMGTGFFLTPTIKCKFGQVEVVATYQSPERLDCIAPPPIDHLQEVVTVEITQNGVDYTNSPNVTFTYQLIRTCPGTPPCSGHGYCDQTKGKCVCTDPEWTGDACNTSVNTNKQGYWNIVASALGGVSVSFVLFLILMGLYSRHRSNEYKRLVHERQRNDISTAL